MPQPTFDERFREKYPTRSFDDRHGWLNAEEQRFILWGLKERWSAARIGRALGVNEATVRRFRNRCWDQPGLLLELGLYEMVGHPNEAQFRCLVCADRIVTRIAAQRHVLSHYLEDDHVEAMFGADAG